MVILGVGRNEGHALVAIDASEPCCQLLRKLAKQMREPQKDRLRGKSEMERPESLHVLVVDRPHSDHDTVAQHAGSSKVHGLTNSPRRGR